MASVAGVVSKTASHQQRRPTNIVSAVAFGYLERLLYIGDTGKFYEEEARLRSLSNVLNQAGFEPYLYEDFADELFNLIRSIANAIGEGSNGDEVLLNAFNDEQVQNYIITHFKVSIHVFHAGVQWRC
jgi:ubiquitin thioesterase protein OTUB1